MPGLDIFRREIRERWPKAPFVELSVAILDLLERHGIEQSSMLTYRTFARRLHTEINEDLIAAIALLSSSTVDALDPHALFIDGDYEQEIPADELLEVTAGAPLVHPETGEIVEDPLSHLMPFFVPSERVKEALGG
jgi:hypothetical protein